jgi:hypothetical protein
MRRGFFILLAVLLFTMPSAFGQNTSQRTGELPVSAIEQKYIDAALEYGIAWSGLFDSAEVSCRDMAQILKNANDLAYGESRYSVICLHENDKMQIAAVIPAAA